VRQPVPFGKYLLLDRISVGGMAEVFKAKSYGVEGFEKIIAIKRILPTMGEDRDFIKMFIDEAKIAGQLAHANICQIFELGRIDGSHFIAMEYIWGKDLLQIQNRLRKIKQAMPIAMACFSIAKVLEGLDYAHRKRDPLGRPLEIVHRDCSPQNVLVSYEGEVKVIDFGIAKATSRNSRTMAGVLKGKFGYMSPEQVRGLPLDRRSDIFAIGTMLYECLTGERLFQGETDFSTLEKVRNVDIRPPREINPAIPEAVEAVILKALAKDVDERYQWCSEMLVDLQAFLMGQDVVFTAKSLSSWLKDVFASEIDRERQQLEQYKRVGRDGLFAGVPAAEAKADVVESLGEAPAVEGDPTTLGGPNFDDLEAAGAPGTATPGTAAPGAAASGAVAAEVGPAPGSPAARGGPLADEDDAEAFGEEAPTEIFGEIDHGVNPAAAASPASSRAPTSASGPLTRPPKPPPIARLSTSPGPVPSSGAPSSSPARPGTPLPSEPSRPSQPGFTMPSYANPANAGAPYQQYGQPPASQAGHGEPSALGTPAAMAATNPSGMPQNVGQANQGRTLPGSPAPAGLPNYSQGYPPPSFSPYSSQPPPGILLPPGMQQAPPHGTQPLPGTQAPQPPPGMHSSQPMPPVGYSQPYPSPQQPNPYAPQSNAYPSSPSAASSGPQNPQNPYRPPGQQNPYAPPGAYNAATSAVEAPETLEARPEARKRSSIVRDVAIGVAIAALVLGGFLAVKFLVLDTDRTVAETGGPASSIATIHVAMTPGISADLFVDNNKIATVRDRQEIPVTAGLRKVRLVGPDGQGCEQEMTLAAGKIAALECAVNAAPSAGSDSGRAGTGGGSASATPGAMGSAAGVTSAAGSGAAAGSGLAAGSAAQKPADAVSSDHGVGEPPDKTDPQDKTNKPGKADRPSERAKPDGVADRPASRSADRPKPKPAAAEDDLGRLQGGTKLGDRKSTDGKSYLNVTSKPTARIAVDGVDSGLSTPIAGRALPLLPGRHKITFTVGGDKFTFPVVTKAGETATLHKDFQ